MVSGSLSLPSRGAFHLSLTVLYSIGHMVVFSLWRWSSILPSGFLVSRRTPDTPNLANSFDYGTFTLSRRAFQHSSSIVIFGLTESLPLTYLYIRFGLLRFRSPLLSESFLLSFPSGIEMFQFPEFPSHTLLIHVWITQYYLRWVPPFGYLRIYTYLQLPVAFRSLSRPSSAHSAKASSLRSSSLNRLVYCFLLRTIIFGKSY